MYCYDENGKSLGAISCISKKGEEHMWIDENVYICTGETTKNLGCKNGMIFKKVN